MAWKPGLNATARPGFVVGLTGGIGSGKSLAASEFERLGATVVDTDAIAHALTAPGGAAIEAIRSQFGAHFISADGALDRARMRALVFSDPSQRRALESVLHPMIRAESERRVATAAGPYVILVVPLLIESRDYRSRVDRVLVIDCPEDLQVSRVRARSGLDEDEVRRIIASQVPRDVRRSAADDIVDNSGTADDLRRQVIALHNTYSRIAAGTDAG